MRHKILLGSAISALTVTLYGAIEAERATAETPSYAADSMQIANPHIPQQGPMPAPATLPAPLLPPEPVARPDEAMAAALSRDKAAAYLDTIAVNWTHQRQCGTCHTNYAYMMARPALGRSEHEGEVRSFFDRRVHERTSRPRLPHTLILAGVLAMNDAEHGRHLQPATREALDQAWEMQGEDGAWAYPEIFYSPPLGDPWYGAAMVALGTGLAPDGYARTPAAKEGMARLRGWFARHPAPSLHHRIILLWAAQRTPGLMNPAQQLSTRTAFLALQHSDGGWSLPSLGEWNRRDGSANDSNAPSDGYATGLVTFVLQESGMRQHDARLARGIAWLKRNQRASGRWFTQSINTDDKGNLISNIGTAYAVLSLHRAGIF